MSGSKTAFYLSMLVVLPFVIGAAFHFFGPWIGFPTLVVCGTYWLGSAIVVAEEARK